MSVLFDLPNDVFSSCILKYLTSTDLWRLQGVSRRFRQNDLTKNAIQREIVARDKTLILSQNYLPDSPLMYIFDHARRVLSFERCSDFAWKMTRQAQRHQRRGFSCKRSGCKCLDLHADIPELANGKRDGKIYLFFVQFTSKGELLWEGFLRDYDPQGDVITPMDDLLRKPDGELNEVTEMLGPVVGDVWVQFEQSYVEESNVELHLDTSNVSNLTKEDVNSSLHVTLISLIHSPEQSASIPELRLHYSSEGCPQLSSPTYESPSVDILHDQYVTLRKNDHATPFLIWKSKPCLHSFSLLYNFDFDTYTFDRDMFYDFFDE
ncbi:hypothetical protein FisN_10Lh279 [Fistulifera solaris]|uniref:F-box domain-containing protein n=1 Tax=Fistulifera solaris TaxID=1519565 RepID=A0A1Z5KG84_FISSO|nr:hypothetical protein FisN_10Lh279 [Fistulifera solaris]|eukprot:GAX25081.1 hypothetical protein FisN_10Lh279 [Fistulifera solaris]